MIVILTFYILDEASKETSFSIASITYALSIGSNKIVRRDKHLSFMCGEGGDYMRPKIMINDKRIWRGMRNNSPSRMGKNLKLIFTTKSRESNLCDVLM